MEGRKLRRLKKQSKENRQDITQSYNKSNKILKLISRILMIIVTVVVISVVGMVIYLKVLPNKFLIPLCALVVVLIGAGLFVLFKKKEMKTIRITASAMSVILIAIFSFVGLKLIKTMNFLGNMTTTTVNAKTYSVVVLKDSKYSKMEDLQYKLLLYYDNELGKNQEAIKKITDAITIVTEKTDDVHNLAKKLINKSVDAILIEDSYYAIIEEEMADFREKTSVIYTFALEDTIQTIAKNVSVTEEPFVIYISGIDSYGKISSVARSDVNMLVVINPKTKQILLVNTPRDYYVKLHGTSGYRDKLTHAGIYGIDMSVMTMEDLYDIDINYYVRVNFTSLIDIIDAIGGVEVYSEYDFTSRIGSYQFKKGYNKMNGKQALGFARERYSFSEGDRMRGQNQQAVINAMIKKVCSSSTILTKFDALLDSLKGSFQTNMDYTKMIELVRMQISDGATWNISSVSVDGSGSMERTYSMGKTLLSVLIPYAGSVNKAETMIKAVLEGEMLEEGNIDISNYNDYLVVSRGVYPKEEEKEEEPEEKNETLPENSEDVTEDSNNQNNENSGDITDNETDTGADNNSGEGTNTDNIPGNDNTNEDNEGGNITDNNNSDSNNSGEGNSDNNTSDGGNTDSSSSAGGDSNAGKEDNANTEGTTPKNDSENQSAVENGSE